MEFTTEQIEEMIHDYIKINLSVELDKDYGWDDVSVVVNIKLKDEVISSDSFRFK